MSTLSLGIVRRIFREIRNDEDFRALASCALGCSAWTKDCHTLMYESMLIDSANDPTIFTKAEAFFASHKRIAVLINHLKLRGTLWSFPDILITDRPTGGSLDARVLSALLCRVPQLQCLEISQCLWSGDDRRSLQFQVAAINKVILEDIRCEEPHSDILQILRFIPQLETLCLHRVRWLYEIPRPSFTKGSIASSTLSVDNCVLFPQSRGWDARVPTITSCAALELSNYVFEQAVFFKRLLLNNTTTLTSLILSIGSQHAGSKERWENIGLGNCARLTSAEITVCLKESSLRELQDTRATAMSTLIPQLPVSLEKLTLRLLVGNSEWWEPYTDLMKPDWSRIGLHLSSLPRFSKLIVQLDPSKEVGGLLLHWTEIKRTVLQENMRGFTPTQGVQMISFFPPLPT